MRKSGLVSRETADFITRRGAFTEQLSATKSKTTDFADEHGLAFFAFIREDTFDPWLVWP